MFGAWNGVSALRFLFPGEKPVDVVHESLKRSVFYLTLSRSRLSTHKRARASEAVRPGDSIPKRWTKPATPCSDGPLSTKSADGSPRPLTCVHTERL